MPLKTGKRGQRQGKSILEKGAWHKNWRDNIPVALIFPSLYRVGMSNLGFQLVYDLINRSNGFLCERFFLDGRPGPPRSVESGRLLSEFPLVFFSVSFEQDFPGIVKILTAAAIPLWSRERHDCPVRPGAPLVVGGGVALTLNPEPVADFFDLVVVGEAEDMLAVLLAAAAAVLERGAVRAKILAGLARSPVGFYVPSLYRPFYDDVHHRQRGIEPLSPAIPRRVRRAAVKTREIAGHSVIVTPEAEFSDMFLVELGRGCSRGCRFCAAGFLYRPPRLWNSGAVRRALAERSPDCRRVGLLGMEMARPEVLATIAAELKDSGCALSFSSLRADAIGDEVLSLLRHSGLKAATIAPDGPSERLRRVINKNISREDVLGAAERMAMAGIFNLKLYFMVGLPSESEEDLVEMVALIDEVRQLRLAIGRRRGRLGQLIVNVSTFVPKAMTPFQFHPMAAAGVVEKRLAWLRGQCRGMANVGFRCDGVRQAVFQAVLSRGDRRLAPVLRDYAEGGNFKQLCRRYQVDIADIIYRERQRGEFSPWDIIDHRVGHDYLWAEYRRGLAEKDTESCRPEACRRCGVCKPGKVDGG